jgi:DNA-binding GntR family transcriptional regulator
MNNLEQIALTTLKARLRSGEIRFGQVISENAFAKEIGISRTPVRHALRQLTSQGVLIQVPHVGAVVPIPKQREIDEIFQVRELVESEAASLASLHATDAQRRSLRECVTQYYLQVRRLRLLGPEGLEGDRQANLERHDLKLHALILQASGNRQLARMASDMQLQTRTRTADIQGQVNWDSTLRKRLRVANEHRAIVQAICQKDSFAARLAMKVHIERGRESFIALMDNALIQGAMKGLPPAVLLLLEQQERATADELFQMENF